MDVRLLAAREPQEVTLQKVIWLPGVPAEHCVLAHCFLLRARMHSSRGTSVEHRCKPARVTVRVE